MEYFHAFNFSDLCVVVQWRKVIYSGESSLQWRKVIYSGEKSLQWRKKMSSVRLRQAKALSKGKEVWNRRRNDCHNLQSLLGRCSSQVRFGLNKFCSSQLLPDILGLFDSSPLNWAQLSPLLRSKSAGQLKQAPSFARKLQPETLPTH